jgi:putative spermidine/putrescine transport system permease protein
MAAAVTVADAILAFPIAFFMAKVASPRTRGLLVVAVLLPLWSGYLVKVYTWRTIMSGGGVLSWVGLGAPTDDLLRIWLVMTYLWLPYMIIPLYAGLERIPNSVLSASEDLGAGPGYTFRRVIMPLVFPAMVAGSIFTFSLTLGDFITPLLVSKTQLIGNVVYANFTTDLPLAAAFSIVPIIVMIAYLLIARRLGAFEHL